MLTHAINNTNRRSKRINSIVARRPRFHHAEKQANTILVFRILPQLLR
jgi:hypothetical protein